MPGADASQNRHNWVNRVRVGLVRELSGFKSLYCAGRTDLGIATRVGMESAEAIISGNRADFDRQTDPVESGTRSELKGFDFKAPVT